MHQQSYNKSVSASTQYMSNYSNYNSTFTRSIKSATQDRDKATAAAGATNDARIKGKENERATVAGRRIKDNE
jgi:hypothetical protein